MRPSRRRFVQAALGVPAAAFAVGTGPPANEVKSFSGKVVRLAEAVARAGGRLDADAAPFWLALLAEDGKLYPLVKDGGSRLFFKDASLLDRPMRLQARFIPGSTLLRVSLVNSVRDGQLFELYYWCDICAIKRGEKMICECCGGPMQLHEDPIKK